ncbi:transcription factor A, mitochondrial [Hemicordylus capensis]|uniref:transcription factor A, mitochondrial n=1 Tax=Hemicordylus capensis TaxID=884348 RepID=UPI002303356B|nr:transcription factor A, mitochondrial [Hemicordylus capensis]
MAAALLARILSPVAGPRYVLRASTTYSVEKWFSKHISSDNRPKHPMTAYMHFYKDHQSRYRKQYPDINMLDIAKKIAHAWRELPASDKQPYEAASKADSQVYKEQMATFKAQLTPAQEAAMKEERRKKMAKRRAMKKRRQLTVLGKPKRPRSAFNVYMSEHFQEAKGVSVQGKMKILFDEWQKMTSSQKKTYQQLAEDDKIRYENEMKSWEEHMIDIGREDLIRYKFRKGKSKEKKTAAKAIAKKRTTTLKKPSGSKAASPATKGGKVKTKQSEE